MILKLISGYVGRRYDRQSNGDYQAGRPTNTLRQESVDDLANVLEPRSRPDSVGEKLGAGLYDILNPEKPPKKVRLNVATCPFSLRRNPRATH
tara:strand:+ start:1411 stop:1689 length:279 start_codon:yes stop_codon:yes gene_type:complete